MRCLPVVNASVVVVEEEDEVEIAVAEMIVEDVGTETDLEAAVEAAIAVDELHLVPHPDLTLAAALILWIKNSKQFFVYSNVIFSYLPFIFNVFLAF